MLATLVDEPFDDKRWVFETKWDGFRLITEKRGHAVRLWSRNGIDVTTRYAVLLCGSDLHNYRAPANPGGVVTGGIKRAAGVIAGHEPCGVVAAVGTAVTDKEARIGQRVMDHHYDGFGSLGLRTGKATVRFRRPDGSL
jgi:threonine dehydrogenase-like Zn-dependent dehydrogenase